MFPEPVKTNQNRYFFYFLLVVAIAAMFWLILPFIGTIFLSIFTVILFYPLYLKILALFRGRTALATFVTIVLIFLIVLIPLSSAIILTINQMIVIIRDITDFFKSSDLSLENVVEIINSIFLALPGDMDFTQITEQDIIDFINSMIQPASQFIIGQATNVLKFGLNSISLVSHGLIFIYNLAALFPNYARIVKFLKKISPLDEKMDEIYSTRIIAMIDSVAKGIFIIAFIQGAISGVFYWIAGVPYLFFWAFLATLLSIIPVGSGFVTIPLGIYLILSGDVWQGVMLILVYVFFVSIIDNILRPKMVSKDAQLPEALILLSIVGGVSTMGFFGIIYGPIILIIFYTTLEMYAKYYSDVGTIIPPKLNPIPLQQRFIETNQSQKIENQN